MAKGCRTDPPGYIGRHAGTTIPYAGVDCIPQSVTKNFATGQVSPLEAEFVEVADPLATTVRHTSTHLPIH